MFEKSTSYLSPKLELRSAEGKGQGVFARQPVKKGELLAVWGGNIFTGSDLRELPDFFQRICIQVEEDMYLVPIQVGPADFVNHSCNPNAGLAGQITLVALRDIGADEEICFDYAMSDSTTYDEFECSCGEQNCRRRITGQDWQRIELWDRYQGFFSPYLQRRIERLNELLPRN
jgi:hypothetical protein